MNSRSPGPRIARVRPTWRCSGSSVRADLDEAAAAIGGAGMPGQNVMIADSAGRIGWVLSGRLPRRQGIDALRPSPWHGEGAGWDGWLPREESPRLLDPPQGYRLERERARRRRRGLSRGSATATTQPRRARARSATGSPRSSARRPPTCWRSSSTTAPTTSRAGSRSSCARSSARARPRPRASSPAGAGTPRSTTRAIAWCGSSSARCRRGPSA